jgi:predicted Zn-dependent protease
MAEQKNEKFTDKIPEDMSTDEIKETVERIQNELDELDRRSKEIVERTGMSTDQLRAYTNNPSNFSAEEWKTLQNARVEIKEFQENMWDALGKDYEEVKKGVEAKKAKKKGRALAGNKKDWIPMS